MSILLSLPPHTVFGICVGIIGILVLLELRIEWIVEDERREMER